MASQVEQPDSRAQCSALEENVKEFGLTYFGFGDRRQGKFLGLPLFSLPSFSLHPPPLARSDPV